MRLKIIYITAILLIFSVAAQAYQLDNNGVIRDDEGRIIRVSHYEASGLDRNSNRVSPDICERYFSGYQLPTIREHAVWAQSQGAQGILENATISPPTGYYTVSPSNPDGTNDEFIFSHDGYRRPQSTLGYHWFWSSSTVYTRVDHAYHFSGYNGNVVRNHFREHPGVIRCVRAL